MQSIGNIALVATATAFLVHFFMIVVLGEVLIQEPHTSILIIEIILMVSLIALGVYNLLKQI